MKPLISITCRKRRSREEEEEEEERIDNCKASNWKNWKPSIFLRYGLKRNRRRRRREV